MHSHPYRAFSLIELSIVLVILGLLVGGVLSGQSLIHASKLRAISTEVNKYTTALNGFRDKFNALPGDMRKAYAYWGSDCGTDTNDPDTGCNGDGNGVIDTNSNGGTDENIKAWEHLARAGLIEGTYDGTNASGVLTTSNTPGSKFPNLHWDINSFAIATDSAIQQCPTNSICLIAGETNSNIVLTKLKKASLEDLWNIDKKIDDGHAATGAMLGDADDECLGSFSATDKTSPWGIGNPYKATDTNLCYVVFIL